MKTIAVCNQKGGVGKSTVVLGIAGGFRKRGFRTLIVDADAQGSVSDVMCADGEGLSLYDVLIGSCTAKQALQHNDYGDIIPANLRLMTDSGLSSVSSDKLFRMKNALAALESDYDVIVIDCPPTLDLIVSNALTAADYVIIPVITDWMVYKALPIFKKSFDSIRSHTNSRLSVMGILFNIYDDKTAVNRDGINLFREASADYGWKLFDTHIRKCAALKESQRMHMADIFRYAPKSIGAQDFDNLMNEILEVMNSD